MEKNQIVQKDKGDLLRNTFSYLLKAQRYTSRLLENMKNIYARQPSYNVEILIYQIRCKTEDLHYIKNLESQSFKIQFFKSSLDERLKKYSKQWQDFYLSSLTSDQDQQDDDEDKIILTDEQIQKFKADPWTTTNKEQISSLHLDKNQIKQPEKSRSHPMYLYRGMSAKEMAKSVGIKNYQVFEYCHIQGKVFYRALECKENWSNNPKNICLGTRSSNLLQARFELKSYFQLKRNPQNLKYYEVKSTKVHKNLYNKKGEKLSFYHPLFVQKIHLQLIMNVKEDNKIIFSSTVYPLRKSTSTAAIEAIDLVEQIFQIEKKKLNKSIGKRLLKKDKMLSKMLNQANTITIAQKQYPYQVINQQNTTGQTKFTVSVQKIDSQTIIAAIAQGFQQSALSNKISSVISEFIEINQLEILVDQCYFDNILYKFKGNFRNKNQLFSEILKSLSLDSTSVILMINSNEYYLEQFYPFQYIRFGLKFQKTLQSFIEGMTFSNIYLEFLYRISEDSKQSNEIGMESDVNLYIKEIKEPLTFHTAIRISDHRYELSGYLKQLSFADSKITLKDVGMSFIKAQQFWEITIFGELTYGETTFYLAGILQKSEKDYSIDVEGSAQNFKLSNLNDIWRNHCSMSDDIPFQILFKQVVVGFSTSPQSKGFRIGCKISFPTIDYLKDSEFESNLAISTNDMKFSFRALNLQIGIFKIKEADIELKLSSDIKQFDLSTTVEFWSTQFQAVLLLQKKQNWVYFVSGKLKSEQKGVFLDILQYMSLEQITYSYASANFDQHEQGHTVSAKISKFSNIDVDMTLKYSSGKFMLTSQKQYNLGSANQTVSKSVKFLPWSIEMELQNVNIAITFKMGIQIQKVTTQFLATVKIAQGIIEIIGKINIKLPNYWEDPLGICTLLGLRPNFFYFHKEFTFGLGINEFMVPTFISLKGGFTLNNLVVDGSIQADLMTQQFTIATRIEKLSLSNIISTAYEIVCKKPLNPTIAEFFNIISMKLLDLNMKVSLLNISNCSFTLKVVDFNLFNIIKINLINIDINSSHIFAELNMEPIQFGPLLISKMTDETQGPYFYLKAAPTQSLVCKLDAKVKIASLFQCSALIIFQSSFFHMKVYLSLFGYSLAAELKCEQKEDYFQASFFADIKNENSNLKLRQDRDKEQIRQKTEAQIHSTLKQSYQKCSGQVQTMRPKIQQNKLTYHQLKTKYIEHQATIFNKIQKIAQRKKHVQNQFSKMKNLKQNNIQQRQQLNKNEAFLNQLAKQEEELNEIYSKSYQQLKKKLQMHKNKQLAVISRENIQLLDDKIQHIYQLQQGFFDYIWQKIKSAFNFVLDLIAAFVKNVLSLLNFSLTEIKIEGYGKISITQAPKFNFHALLCFSWFGKDHKISVGTPNNIDGELMKLDASEKLNDHLLQKFAMKQYNVQKFTPSFGRGQGDTNYSTLKQKGQRIIELQLRGRGQGSRNAMISFFRKLFSSRQPNLVQQCYCTTKQYTKTQIIQRRQIGRGLGNLQIGSLSDIFFGKISLDYNDEVEYVKIGYYDRPLNSIYAQHDNSICSIEIKTENKLLQIAGIEGTQKTNKVYIHGLLQGMTGKFGQLIESAVFSYLTTPTPRISLQNLADSPYQLFKRKEVVTDLNQNKIQQISWINSQEIPSGFIIRTIKSYSIIIKKNSEDLFIRKNNYHKIQNITCIKKLKIYYANYRTGERTVRYIKQFPEGDGPFSSQLVHEVQINWDETVKNITIYTNQKENGLICGLGFDVQSSNNLKTRLIGFNKYIKYEQKITGIIKTIEGVVDRASSLRFMRITMLTEQKQNKDQLKKMPKCRSCLADLLQEDKNDFVCKSCWSKDIKCLKNHSLRFENSLNSILKRVYCYQCKKPNKRLTSDITFSYKRCNECNYSICFSCW